MATLVTKWPTLLDITARMDPNGMLADIGELLSQSNPILDDMPWVEGNRPDGTVHVGRSALPSVGFRRLNQGVAPTKSQVTQFSDVTGIMETNTEVDVLAARKTGDPAKFRADEEVAQLEAFNQKLAYTLFYGNAAAVPEEFTGVAPRLNALGTNVRTSHCFDAGGQGDDNTSIFLMAWSPKTVAGLYPKFSKAGIEKTPLPDDYAYDAADNKFLAHRANYRWENGLMVKDWRFMVRIANIDVSDLYTAGDSTDVSANLIKLMTWAMHLIPTNMAVKPVFYAHPDVVAMLAVKQMFFAKTLSISDMQGVNGITRQGVLSFLGHPVHGCDQILLTESKVN